MSELARAGIVVVATIILLAIVAVAVVLPYGILVRATECGRLHAAERAPRAKISEVYDSLKTGDILLFASSAPVLSNSGITQTLYGHVALLLRDGDIVATSEATMGAELVPAAAATGTGTTGATGTTAAHMRPGAASAPLLTRIKYYSGRVYVMRLSRELDPARSRRLTAAADALHRTGYPYPTAAQACAATMFGTATPARHCFQHVAYLLGVADSALPKSAARASFRCAEPYAASRTTPCRTGSFTSPPLSSSTTSARYHSRPDKKRATAITGGARV